MNILVIGGWGGGKAAMNIGIAYSIQVYISKLVHLVITLKYELEIIHY